MSVHNQQPIATYVANGETTQFTITFDLHDSQQLVVLVNNQIPEVGAYLVEGGEVVFSSAPSDGSTITLYRDTDLERTTNYKNFDGSFSPKALNWDLDKIWHVLQEQNVVDAKILGRIKEEIEWRRTHDFNYDTLAQVRDLQVFDALKQYLDTIVASTNPNVFGGVTAGVVFALDHKSVQTHLDMIYQQLLESRELIILEKNRAINAEQALRISINTEIQRATGVEAGIQSQVNALGGNLGKAYSTYVLMSADKANIPNNSIATVTNDPEPLKNGAYSWDGTTFTKSEYDPLTQAKNYTDAKVNTPEVVFTSSISVDSNGVVSFPVFYGAKAGQTIKKYEEIYTFTPEQYGYFYAIYYNFETHSISNTTATIRPINEDECLIGIAYSGRFSSKYAVKYKGETNVIPKLSNEILNGSLNTALPIDTLYAYTNQSSTDYAPIVSVSDNTLTSLGIRNAQKLEASAKRGGFGQAQLFNRKLRSLKCAVAVVAYDPTGIFNFGTTGGITAYFQKLNADGTATANFLTANLTAFHQLSENVRLYTYSSATVSLSQTTYPDSYISNILVGGRVDTDAPNPIYLSGYWFSQTDDLKGYKYPIALSDTHYPSYLNVSSASIYEYFSAKATANTLNIAAIDTRLKAIENYVAPKSPLASLYDDLHNPLMSVNIKLVGDSITWGSGASNRSAFDPRNGTLADVRNKIDPMSPSWANLLRQWLCATYTDGVLIDEGVGSGYAESTNIILLSKDTDYFKFSNPTRSLSFSSNAVRALIGVSASLNSREYLDIVPPSYPANYPSEFSFEMNGTGFDIVFARFANGTADTYFFNVYIDDVFFKKVSLYAESASFNHEEFIALPDDGKHKVTIKNESSVNNVLRLQNLSVVKTVRVANDGINGSTTYSWLNTVKLSQSIKRKDDYVFVQLGTNDRITSTHNSLNSFASNLSQIVDDIYTLSNNNAKVILMSANALTKDESSTSPYYCSMKTINSAIKQVAGDKRLSFISNFEHTQQLKIDNIEYLSDGLHPNDLGYRAMFENIKNHIVFHRN